MSQLENFNSYIIRNNGNARIWCGSLLSIIHLIPFNHIHLYKFYFKKDDSESQNKDNKLSLYDIALYGFECGVTLLQIYCDFKSIASSFLLREAELSMLKLSESLSDAKDSDVASQITTLYFDERKYHRKIIKLNRHWIYYSLACDGIHLICRFAEVFMIYNKNSNLKKLFNIKEWNFNDMTTVVSYIWCSLLSISMNSIWYNIYVRTPSFKP